MIRNQKTALPSKSKILGLWNLEKYQPLLGAVIIYATELQMLRQVYGAKKIEVCFAGGPIPEFADIINRLDSFLPCINSPNLENMEEIFSGKYLYVWPEMTKNGQTPWEVKTLSIQKLFRKTGILPRFTLNSDILVSANKNLRNLCPHKFCVVVHLKNMQGKESESNADLRQWEQFFSYYVKDRSIGFVIVGNEPISKIITDLPNVYATFSEDVCMDLGAIQMADMFIGMASGPANAAIFSTVPYVIFKNPWHHTAEMKVELGNSDRFPFALPTQKILRKKQTSKIFSEEFLNIKKQL